MLGGGTRFGIFGGFTTCENDGLVGSSGVNLGGPNSGTSDDISLCTGLFSPSKGDGISALGGFGGGTFFATLGSV